MILEVNRGDGFGHGLFSNFLKVIHTLMVAKKNRDKVIIDLNWNGYNVWEKMFKRVDNYIEEERTSIYKKIFWNKYPTDDDIKKYKLNKYSNPLSKFKDGYIFTDISIYNNIYFSELRKLYNIYIKKLEFTDDFKREIDEKEKLINNPDKTLAVFIRSTKHYNITGNIYADFSGPYLEPILSEIDNIIDNYENILLLTQIKEATEIFKEKYGNKLICFLDRPLLKLNEDWEDNYWSNDFNLEKEWKDCFIDVYLASKCKFILGGSSNMLLGALFINPEVEFKIFDVLNNYDGR